MKSRTFPCITAMTLLAALSLPVQLAAQNNRYKLIDIGTLGGPNSSVGFEGFPLNALSSQDVFTACADTSVRDNDYPNINPFIFPGSALNEPTNEPIKVEIKYYVFTTVRGEQRTKFSKPRSK